MKEENYLDRDLSWLSFNQRVLMEAADESVPVFERVKFLAIYSSNLDEFFRVRIALIKRIAKLNKDKLSAKVKLDSPKSLLSELLKVVTDQQNLFGEVLRAQIMPELLRNKFHLVYNTPFLPEHKLSIEEIFYGQLLSFIQPIIIAKDAIEDVFLENRKLYIVCDLTRDGRSYIGIINIPSQDISRFQLLSSTNGEFYYAFIDDIIKHFAHVIFANFEVESTINVKLNRDAELFLEDDYSDDVAIKIRTNIKNRRLGSPSRMLIEPGISVQTLELLKTAMQLEDEDCIVGGSYHNMDDLFQLQNPIGKLLEYPALPPLRHPQFANSQSVFNAIEKSDILLCFPYHRYEYVLRLFNEAAINPDVTSIKATLYRVAEHSHITNALISAARNGKNVQVLIEAKARFDEENNLKWAEKMQESGVIITYSQPSIKVHAKVALFTSQTDKGVMKYAFLGTGNFNEKTATIYTDFAMLTCDPKLTDELDKVFDYTFGQETKISLSHLLIAQINMRQKFVDFIDQEIKNKQSGGEGRITLKLNNLEDKSMIMKLYEAADQGVKIELIIRGICCLVPRTNIHLCRLVDRFLEHSRIFIFHNSGEEKIYLGSADWMKRNLNRRIEVVFPVYDEYIKSEIKHHIKMVMADNVKLCKIDEKMENSRLPLTNPAQRVQHDYYTHLKELNN